ncbi:MAG: hypothetical protein RQ952_03205 [Thermoproteota archaeon]|jgi:thiol-disulfide isomerase/thioredoxin|nr:hypothetical protein [Thermoproteota archaeon]
MKVQKVIFVKANWCPHCKVSEKYVNLIAKELNAEILYLDIDKKEDEKLADEIVKKFGDWSADYLIPQVFLQFKDGTIKHILTGDPRGVDFTIKRWNDFILSNFYRELKSSA